jgi:hypothetical protein
MLVKRSPSLTTVDIEVVSEPIRERPVHVDRHPKSHTTRASVGRYER